MAVLVFGNNHYLRVHGGVEETIGLFARSQAGADGWARVQAGTATVRVNPAQVAYIAEDSAFPERLAQVAEPQV